ncbi:MAG: DUF3102 domain-containing protein [Elainellaceae cyanobacterium]
MDNLAKQDNQSNGFDYQLLTSEQQRIVQQRTGEIRERLRRTAQDIWEIGQRLVEVRSQLKYGQFEAWLKAEFGWSRRTAYNFISVYETFQGSANFAQIDIATSALYLLAAPSTSPHIRNEVLERAQKGEKITYKGLHDAIKSEKNDQDSSSSSIQDVPPSTNPGIGPDQTETSPRPESPSPSAPEIVAVISQSTPQVNLQMPPSVEIEPLENASVSLGTAIPPGWYCLGSQHLLFCGDTASPEFAARVAHASLALAITSDDWDHDWVIEQADSAIILRESALKAISVKELILTFSQKGEVIVFPWLPDAEMVSIAHDLDRRVIAGDPDPLRCAQAAAATKLPINPIVL